MAQDSKVFVNNLPWTTTKESLAQFMSEVGHVEDVHIYQTYHGKSKGCAIVTFSSAADAKTAIETFDNKDFDGRVLRVREDRGERVNREERDEDNTTLYVANVPRHVKWQEVKDLFKKYNVAFCQVFPPRGNRRNPTGGAIVKVPKDQADLAIKELNETEFEGNTITVRYDRSVTKV